jgi:hypothetical protein
MSIGNAVAIAVAIHAVGNAITVAVAGRVSHTPGQKTGDGNQQYCKRFHIFSLKIPVSGYCTEPAVSPR